jgi:ribose 5-phosphate isomerase RpiB
MTFWSLSDTFWSKSIAALARQQNDTNILELPSCFLSFSQATDIAEVFFMTEFEGGHYKIKIDTVTSLVIISERKTN